MTITKHENGYTYSVGGRKLYTVRQIDDRTCEKTWHTDGRVDIEELVETSPGVGYWVKVTR